MASAGGQIYSGMAANAQGKYAQAVANQNAELEDRSRKEAIAQGETAQVQHYRRLSQALGEARARSAASGVDVSFGSAANLQEDISLIGYEDSSTLAQNTMKQVQGFDINANNYRMQGAAARSQGKQAMTAGFIGAAGTLLSTASTAMKGGSSTTAAKVP